MDRDEQNGLYYILHDGRKMYMKRSFELDGAADYYRALSIEQDTDSPHCYFTKKESLKGKTVVDCGAAEGIFALDYIDEIEELYLIEPDPEWTEALSYTFQPWEKEVHIINKFVGREDESEHNIFTLDSFLSNSDVDIIKLDIEGAEEDALIGARKTLKINEHLRLFACVYHNEDDEEKVRQILQEGWKTICRKGYMLLIWGGWKGPKLNPPFFRKGVIEFIKNS